MFVGSSDSRLISASGSTLAIWNLRQYSHRWTSAYNHARRMHFLHRTSYNNQSRWPKRHHHRQHSIDDLFCAARKVLGQSSTLQRALMGDLNGPLTVQPLEP
jgi:hypothetical protein